MPLNIFIATSVALHLAYRAVGIVRESVTEAAPSVTGGKLSAAIVEGTLRAGSRLLVLLVSAFAITCFIAIARQTAA